MSRTHSRQSFEICLALALVSLLASPFASAMSANGMQNIGELTLSDSTNGGLYSAVIDSVNGFAYFGGKNFITKVDITGALPAEIGTIAKGAQTAAVIDVAAGYAYFCSSSNILRISLGAGNNPPTFVDTLALPNSAWGAVIDTSDPNTANHYAYVVCQGSSGNPYSVVKVSIATFTIVGSVTLNPGEIKFRRGAIDTQNGYAYFLSPWDETAGPSVVKIALGSGSNPPTRVGAVQLDAVSHATGSAVIDVANGYAYFGTYYGPNSVPAKVYKVALGAGNAVPSLVGSVTLSAGTGAQNGPNAAERELCTAVIDPASGYAYFGTDHTYPAKIFQIALGSGNAAPVESGMLQLTGGTHALGEPNGPNDGEQFTPRTSTENIDYGEVFTQSSVIDTTRGDPTQPGSHYAYFGCDSYAGQIVKVLLPGAPVAPVVPSITNGPPPNGTAGSAYNFAYTATGSPAPTFSVTAGSLPPGLSINSAGVISGTPNAAGTFSGTVTATNGTSPDATQNFNITIPSSGATAPQFTSPVAASASIVSVSQTVSFTAAATDPNGGTVTFTWDFGDGTNATGATVSHAYSATGGFTVTATATSSGGTASSSVAITVGNAPVITSPLSASAIQNAAFSYTIAVAAAGTAPITFQAQNLPAGLSQSGNTISGTPTVAGSVSVALTATNAFGADNETLVLNISLPAGTANAPPVLSAPPTSDSNTGTVGQPVAFSVAATDPGGNQLSYTWNFGDGSSAVGANVSHVFGAFGIYTVTVTVSDGTNAVASTLNFVVNAVDTTGSNVAGADWDVAALNAFKILKGAMKFNFASSTKDTLMYSGTIPVLKAFIPAGKTVTVAIGALKKTFTLNARGQGSSGASKFQMQGKMKKGMFKATPAKFTLKIRGEPLLGTFSQFGFANVNTIKTGEPHGVPVIIMIDQTGYENMAATLYKAKAGKSGTATVLK